MGHQIFSADVPDRILKADDRSAERMPIPESTAELVGQKTVMVIISSGYLLQDHLALGFKFMFRKSAVEKHVAYYLKRLRKIFAENGEMIGNTLVTCPSIGVDSDGIELRSYLVRRPLFGTFEKEVFNKVRGPAHGRLFVPGATCPVNADCSP